ncbi:MAG: hypothetical protein QM785_13105 [Pyrinomonadaceae bacterium]
MFCPKCGKAEQVPETFCRQCGVFLPDLTKPIKRSLTPADHVKANLILNAMTVVTCFVLAAMLYTMVAFRADTHWVIYLTAGLLIAMGCWHTQTLWRSILLRRHFNKQQRDLETSVETLSLSAATENLLDQAEFENFVPASVTDRTTRQLENATLRSSQPKH